MRVFYTFAANSECAGSYVEVAAPSRALAGRAMYLAGFTRWWGWPWDEETFMLGVARHRLRRRARLLIDEMENVSVIKQEEVA